MTTTVTSVANTYFALGALRNAAIAAFGTQFIDCNMTGNGTSVTCYLQNPVGGQQATWDGIVSSQDPVILTLDKPTMLTDGVDFVTVSVNAPKPGAAAVTLQVTLPDGSTQTQAVTMTGGVGSVQIKTQLFGSYSVTITGATNRTTDVLSFEAK